MARRKELVIELLKKDKARLIRDIDKRTESLGALNDAIALIEGMPK